MRSSLTRLRDSSLFILRSSFFGLAVVGLVAAAIRLAFLYRAPVFLTGDSQSHFLPGFDLARGLGFDPELRRTPGYPLFVAAMITVLGEELRSVAFAQHVLGTLTALLTYCLGRLTLGPLVGLASGVLVAVDGALILSEHTIMTEGLFGTLLLGSLAAVAWGRSRPGSAWLWYLLGGILLGLATLTRPVAQILVLVIPFGLLVVERRWQPALRASLVVWLGFTLPVGPWMLRNLTEHGSLTASGGLGRSLVARTVKYDTGYLEADIQPAGPDDLKGQVRQFIRGKRNTIRNSRSVRSTQAGMMKELGLTQAQSDSLMRQVAIEAIAGRPLYYLSGTLRMATQILAGKEKEDSLATRWSQRTDKDWVEQWEARIDHLVAPASPAEQREFGRAEGLVNIYQPVTFGPILPALALLGLGAAAALAAHRSAVLAGLTAVALVLTSAALDGPVPRYRYPVDPLIALLATGGVVVVAGQVAALMRRRAEVGRAGSSAARAPRLARRRGTSPRPTT